MEGAALRLQFLGAARQVTGSRYLLEAGGLRVMVDCGLFQERAFRARNWEMPLVEPGSVDVVLLTHGHLDHCGLIPRLVKSGFDASIIATEPSVDIARLIMLDSGRIHEEDAAYKAKRHRKEGRKGPHPEVPLYTAEDAERATKSLRGVGFGKPIALNDAVSVTFHEAGHILGAASLELKVRENGSTSTVVFSGDVGQWDKVLIPDPELLRRADHVVMESTYGDRNHRECGDIAEQLAEVINDTVDRGGDLVIPTFAVERAQELIFHIGGLIREKHIPKLPVYLDSPMAVDVTDIFRTHRAYLGDDYRELFWEGHSPLWFPGLSLVKSVEQSKAINKASSPKIVMSTSGMCDAGRIKHHLKRSISRGDSTVLFVGFQAHGTLGRQILDRDRKVRIHGRRYQVHARVAQICGFSAHGDRDDLLRWLGAFESPPQRVFLTHGEEEAALALAGRIEDDLGLAVTVPEYKQVVELGRV